MYCRRCVLYLSAFLMSIVLMWTSIAVADDLNEAAQQAIQELQRQQARERALREQQETRPDVRFQSETSPSGMIPEEESPCFEIDHIRLVAIHHDANAAHGVDSGASPDPDVEAFQWALAAANTPDPAVGRCLGVAGINVVMKRIQDAIIAKGFVTTRVLVAPQNLSSGTLTFTLIPGRIRQIRFKADTSSRATLWNALPAAPGDLLNLRDIEQALENFKRVPTVDADIQIMPADGDQALPGESDLVISWQQRAIPARIALSLDDAGSESTGHLQASATISLDHLLHLNDLFYVSVNHDAFNGSGKGTRGYTGHYSVPYGYWTLGTTVSGYKYHQTVVGLNQDYLYSGTSDNAELRLSRLVYRDASRKTSLYGRGWMRQSNNFIDDTEVQVQRRRTAGWEAGIQHREYWGPVTLDADFGYRRGTGAFNARPAPEEAFGQGTARMKLITADLSMTWPFKWGTQDLSWQSRWRGQWNRTPLVPQDRFSIGSRYTVRGFDGERTLLGDRGWFWRNDLGWRAVADQTLYLGLDYGHVGGRSTALLTGQQLAGAVIGVKGGYGGFYWDLFAGTPVYQPDGFNADHWTSGFYLSWSY